MNQRSFADFRSILRYSASVNHSDYNALPLGKKPKRLNEYQAVTTGSKANDHHADPRYDKVTASLNQLNDWLEQINASIASTS